MESKAKPIIYTKVLKIYSSCKQADADVHIHTNTHIYKYIYIERDRETERETDWQETADTQKVSILIRSFGFTSIQLIPEEIVPKRNNSDTGNSNWQRESVNLFIQFSTDKVKRENDKLYAMLDKFSSKSKYSSVLFQ